ncbi:hypothetical protein VPNG_05493 [Cytospora leucostoma]|uniref:Uncharacterized protein n=1 Tax=Cytospora leucostoma TaxID=1230097 RepID=A0A423XBM2_9PEZI|nr:hypothetical protein VPNG_05493 [Cytospora leucostoma]
MVLVQSSLPSASNKLSDSSQLARVFAMILFNTPISYVISKLQETTSITWRQMVAWLGPTPDPKLLGYLPQSSPDFDAYDGDVSVVSQSFDYCQVVLPAILKRPFDIALATPKNQMEAYVFLLMAIYLFSNNFIPLSQLAAGKRYANLFANLDLVFALVDEEHLQTLLQSRLSSIRAAWEKLLLAAGICKQAAALQGKEEIVMCLLEAGAAVNAPAIRRGFTALQAICTFTPDTQEKQERKVRIIKSLIDYGANINAAPAMTGGFTALQATAHIGDLDTAILLLQQGADVNAPPCRDPRAYYMNGNALDTAAAHGRLDMVKLLLSVNALSQLRGDTGYDGAIQLAEESSHFSVAELIRKHAAENRSDKKLENPYLSHPPRDWHEYEKEWDRAEEG